VVNKLKSWTWTLAQLTWNFFRTVSAIRNAKVAFARFYDGADSKSSFGTNGSRGFTWPFWTILVFVALKGDQSQWKHHLLPWVPTARAADIYGPDR